MSGEYFLSPSTGQFYDCLTSFPKCIAADLNKFSDRDPTVNEETQSTSPREEQPDIERQVQQTVNKPKTVKKAAAQARRDHPKRTRSRPSKYKDFVSR